MTPPAAATDWVSEARAELGEVRRLLHAPSPEALDRCGPHLEQAIKRLASLEAWLRSGARPNRQELRQNLDQIRREMSDIGALMESAAGFYQGWGQLLASLTGGYSPKGVPPAPPAIRRLALEG